jgi:predicted CoA-binding protein
MDYNSESMKKTVVLGATENPDRYAYRAAHSLTRHGHPVELVGQRQGTVAGVPIHTDQPLLDNVHTVTLYVGTRNLPPLYDYILSLNPRRIIFNPGTENSELRQRAAAQGIETVYGCTLVMLATDQY